MLVLSRKSRESVVVGGSGGFERVLKVTVLEIRGGKVRLGFDVDQDVPVHRLEVWERIRGGQVDLPVSRGPPLHQPNHDPLVGNGDKSVGEEG
jgi:carbon storage regulator